LISLNDPAKLSAKIIFDQFPRRIEKKFGQNFLFDEKINRKIVSMAGNLDGKIVVEVGPGPGGLTLEILKHSLKKMYIVELDPHWSGVWRDLSPLFEGKLEIIEADALRFDFKSVSPHIIISNLPYNVSLALLLKWLKELNSYENLILMFQKEVADRLCAIPSTKAYGKLSVLTQYVAQVKKVFDVESGSFFPAPKVKSTVVRIAPHLKYGMWNDAFVDLLTSAFSCRRKTVIKSLSRFLKDPGQTLLQMGYNANTRAEEITVEDYAKLFRSIVDLRRT
jgi:16S rRNA (adenine1518-N6/adenine1519-N6)-dimethyltransferase